jgi:hypothetical protein
MIYLSQGRDLVCGRGGRVMLIDHPGYNRDRGPATVLTMRVSAQL